MPERKIIIYDCEIVKCIPPKDGRLDPTLEYCESWGDFFGMGISVIGYWSSLQDEDDGYGYLLPGSMSVQNFREYATSLFSRHNVVIGFNSRNFDDRLMAAHGVVVRTTYDLLEEIRITAYGSPGWRDCPPGYSYKLDALARVNGTAKTATGELAPVMWQKGLKTEVVEYCVNDVKITRELLGRGLTGHLIDPNTHKRLQLRNL